MDRIWYIHIKIHTPAIQEQQQISLLHLPYFYKTTSNQIKSQKSSRVPPNLTKQPTFDHRIILSQKEIIDNPDLISPERDRIEQKKKNPNFHRTGLPDRESEVPKSQAFWIAEGSIRCVRKMKSEDEDLQMLDHFVKEGKKNQIWWQLMKIAKKQRRRKP